MLEKLKRRVGRYLRTHRKAVAGLVTQAATTAISWFVIHSKLDVDAETAAWLAGTAGSLCTAALISLFPNDPE